MKILFIAGHEFLYHTQNGGQKCSLRNYSMLKKIYGETNVYLCMFSNYKYMENSSEIKIFPTQKNNIELFINTLMLRNVCSRGVMKLVMEYIQKREFDLCFVDSSIIGGLVEKLHLKVPVVVFFHNIEKNYAWNKFKHEGFKYIVAYYSYYWNEKKAVRAADQVILLNRRDEKELQRIYGRSADYLLPISLEDVFEEKKIVEDFGERMELLFVGSLFQPNYEGILWFVENVMSKLNKEKYLLNIVGKNLEKKRKELERDHVKVIGTVESLAEFYYSADVVVIPVFYGNGMKVKTAEAMMYGKKILAADEALEGYDVQGVEGICRCNREEEFLEALTHCGKRKFWESVRKLYETKYSMEALRKGFQEFLDLVQSSS